MSKEPQVKSARVVFQLRRAALRLLAIEDAMGRLEVGYGRPPVPTARRWTLRAKTQGLVSHDRFLARVGAI